MSLDKMRRIFPLSMRTRISRTGAWNGLVRLAAVGQDRAILADAVLGNHDETGVGFEAGYDAAAGVVEPGPPNKVVIAEVEDVGRTRCNRQGLGGGDVVETGGRDGGVDRALGVAIVDDVQLRPADGVRETRPIGAELAQSQSRRIDEMYRLADLASQAATGLRDQMSEQRAECLARALGIGVGEGRARYRPSSEVVEPVRMAGEAGFDLAQALRARQLPVQKGDELVSGRQPAHPPRAHPPADRTHAMARASRQCGIRYSDAARRRSPSMSRHVARRSENRRINAMRLVY